MIERIKGEAASGLCTRNPLVKRPLDLPQCYNHQNIYSEPHHQGQHEVDAVDNINGVDGVDEGDVADDVAGLLRNADSVQTTPNRSEFFFADFE